MRDWTEIRRACEERGESLESLSRRLDIPYSTLCNRAVKEKWNLEGGEALFQDTEREVFGRVAGKLLSRIDACLDEGRDFDLKELKSITGALKELQSLGEGRDGESDGGRALTVRFLGEAEEMSL